MPKWPRLSRIALEARAFAARVISKLLLVVEHDIRSPSTTHWEKWARILLYYVTFIVVGIAQTAAVPNPILRARLLEGERFTARLAISFFIILIGLTILGKIFATHRLPYHQSDQLSLLLVYLLLAVLTNSALQYSESLIAVRDVAIVRLESSQTPEMFCTSDPTRVHVQIRNEGTSIIREGEIEVSIFSTDLENAQLQLAPTRNEQSIPVRESIEVALARFKGLSASGSFTARVDFTDRGMIDDKLLNNSLERELILLPQCPRIDHFEVTTMDHPDVVHKIGPSQTLSYPFKTGDQVQITAIITPSLQLAFGSQILSGRVRWIDHEQASYCQSSMTECIMYTWPAEVQRCLSAEPAFSNNETEWYVEGGMSTLCLIATGP